jgi:hypothetical protein
MLLFLRVSTKILQQRQNKRSAIHLQYLNYLLHCLSINTFKKIFPGSNFILGFTEWASSLYVHKCYCQARAATSANVGLKCFLQGANSLLHQMKLTEAFTTLALTVRLIQRKNLNWLSYILKERISVNDGFGRKWSKWALSLWRNISAYV